MKTRTSLITMLILFIVTIPFYISAANTAGNLAFSNENANGWEKITHAFSNNFNSWIALVLVIVIMILLAYEITKKATGPKK